MIWRYPLTIEAKRLPCRRKKKQKKFDISKLRVDKKQQGVDLCEIISYDKKLFTEETSFKRNEVDEDSKLNLQQDD